MKKNVAGQAIGAQMASATDGSEFTGSVTVYVTGDAGTQAIGSVGSGACTHEGHGYHTYAPAQAETNYDLIAFTFIGTGAIPATVQVPTAFPQTGDAYGVVNDGTFGNAKLIRSTTPANTLSVDASGRVDLGKWLGTAVTLSSGVPDVNIKTITAGILAAASFAANALDAVWSTTARTLTAFAFSVTASTVTDKTGYALTTTPAVAGDAMTLTSGERTTLAASLWNALTSGLSTSGSIGKLIVDNLNATIASVKALLPAALIGGRMDSSTGAMANSVLTAVAIAPSAIDAGAISTDAGQEIADRLLARNIAGGSDGGVTVFTMLAAMGMDFSVVGGVLTVKSPIDGATVYTRTLSRTAGLDALTGSVP